MLPILLSLLFSGVMAPPALAVGDVAAQLPNYPLSTCLVTGKPLDSEPILHDQDGQLVALCCKGCVKKVVADPTKYLAIINKEVIDKQKSDYPFDTCLVMDGEPLVEDEVVDHVYQSRLFRFCCEGCVDGFVEDPAAYQAKVDAALIKKQSADYPVTDCLVKGKPMGDNPVDLLYGTTLLKFCCKGCVKTFHADPKKFLGKLAAARAAVRQEPAEGRSEG